MLEFDDHAPHIPRDYADCDKTAHCPWVRCRYHLGLDVIWHGKRLREQDPETFHEKHHTCALAAAGERPRSVHEIAELMGCTPEYVRLTLNEALAGVWEAFDAKP